MNIVLSLQSSHPIFAMSKAVSFAPPGLANNFAHTEHSSFFCVFLGSFWVLEGKFVTTVDATKLDIETALQMNHFHRKF